MKKTIILSLTLFFTPYILHAQNQEKTHMEINLLNADDSKALYVAMKEFIDTKKIEEMPNFELLIKNDQATIEVNFSEINENLEKGQRGGGNRVFIYTISKENSQIIDTQNLLER